MTTETWNGGSGAWGSPGNWTGGVPDSGAAQATIAAGGVYTVSLAAGTSYTVSELLVDDATATLDLAGTLALGGAFAQLDLAAGAMILAGTLAGGTLSVAAGAILSDAGGAVSGALDITNNATLNLAGYALTLDQTGYVRSYVEGGGTLDLAGTYQIGGLYLDGGTTLDITGLAIQDGESKLDFSGASSAAALTIAAGGVYEFAGSVDLDNGGTASVVNDGLITKLDDDDTGTFNEAVTTTGTIDVARGAIALAAGGVLAGTLTGAGTLVLDGGSFTLAPSDMVVADVVLQAGILGLGENLTYGGSLALDGGTTLDLNGQVLDLTGADALSPYVVGAGTFDIAGTAAVGGLQLGGGGTELITGTALQTGEARLNFDGASAAAILSIAAGGVYDFAEDDADLDVSGAADVINEGLLGKLGDSHENIIYASVTNTGTIDVAQGEITLNDGGTLAGTLAGAGTLFLNNGSYTLDASVTVATLALGNGTVTLADDLAYGGDLDGAGETVDLAGNTLDLSGTAGGANGFGVLFFTGGGVVDLSGTAETGAFWLDAGVTENVTGTVIQDGEVRMSTGTTAAAAEMSIAATGTYVLDGAIDDSGNATLINDGLLTKFGDVNEDEVNVDFTQASGGTISIAAGEIQFQNHADSLAGTLTGAGDLIFDEATVTAAAGLVDDIATLSLESDTYSLGGDETYGGDLLDTGFVSTSVIALNGHTLVLNGQAFFDNEFAYETIAGAGTVVIAGTALTPQDIDYNGVALVGGADMEVTGTFLVEGGIGVGLAAGDSAALDIAAGGTLAIDTAHLFTGTGTIDNDGTIDRFGNESITVIDPVVSNSAVIDIMTGGLDFASIVNMATITVAAGAEFAAATLSGTGTITLGADAVAQVGDTAASSQTFALQGADDTIDIDNALSFNAEIIGFAAGDVIDVGTAANGFTYANDTLTLTETPYNDPTTIVATLALPGVTGTDLSIRGDGNGGTDVELAPSPAGFTPPGGAMADSFTASSGGSWSAPGDWSTGSVPTTASYADFAPALGDITVTYDTNATITAIVEADPVLFFNETAGVLVLTSGGTIDGVVEQTGGTLAVTGGMLTLAGGGAFDGVLSGGVDFTGGIATLGGTLLLGGSAVVDNFASLDNVLVSGTGELAISGTALLSSVSVSGGATIAIADGGTADLQGNVSLGLSSTDSAALTIESGGTLDLLDNVAILGDGTAGVANAGLFEKTAEAGAGDAAITAAFDNTGTLDILAGTLDLEGGGTLAGLVEGPGALDLRGGTTTLESTGSFAIATLGLANEQFANATLALAGDVAYAGQFLATQQGGDVELDGDSLILAGFADIYGADVQGGGTLDLTGTAEIGDVEFSSGTTLEIGGSVAQFNIVQFGASSTDVTAATITGTYDITGDNNNNIVANGTAAITNLGTFEKTADIGSENIQVEFDNSGLVDAVSAPLDFNGGGTFGGTLAGTAIGLGTGSFTLDDATLAVDTLGLGNGNLVLASDESFAGTLTDGNFGAISLAGHDLTLSGQADLDDLTVVGDGVVSVTGSAEFDNVSFVGGATLDDLGTIDWGDSYVQLGSSSTDQATLLVAGGAVFDDTVNYTFYNNGANRIVNSGTFEKTGDPGTTNIGPSFTNAAGGIVDAASGVLAFDGGAVFGGTLAGGVIDAYGNMLLSGAVLDAATLALSGNATLGTDETVLAGTTLNASGIGVDGLLTLGGNDLTILGDATFDGETVGGAGAIIDEGSVELANASFGGGATLDVLGTAVWDSPYLQFGFDNTDSSALSIAAGGVFNDATDYSISDNGAATITNAGLFEKTADTGQTNVQTTLVNSGTVLAALGTLNFEASVTNTGTMLAQGLGGLDFGTVAGAGLIEMSGATIALYGPVAAGQTIDFAGTSDLLVLNDPSALLGTLSAFAAGDRIFDTVDSLTAGLYTVSSGGALIIPVTGGTAESFTFAPNDDDLTVTVTPDGAGALITAMPCYAAGTRLLSLAGEVAVEDIAVGDRLVTVRDGGPLSRRVVWVGRRSLDLTSHPAPARVQPVRISAGAIAPGVPARDLRVSPNHAIYLDGRLFEAASLVNGVTIRQERVTHVTYHHVELDAHDIILAEGLPAESFLDTGNRAMFGGAVEVLHPDFYPRDADGRFCAPLIRDGGLLAAVSARLARRAAPLCAVSA